MRGYMADLNVRRPALLAGLVLVVATGVACRDNDPAPPPGVPTATPFAKVPEPTIVPAGTRTIGAPATAATATPSPTPTATATPTPPPLANYTVVAGDAMSIIARRFATTAEAIRGVNNLPNDDIRIGQVLKIPGATSPTPPPAATVVPPRPTPPPVATDSYVVKPGDTAFGIALEFQVTLAELEQANGVPAGGLNNIRSGQTIRVPKAG